MAQDIGTVYVQVKPSGKDFGKTLEGQITPGIDKAGAKGSTSLITKLGGAFGKIGKAGLGAVTTITGGIVALAAKGGFTRALNIENAQAKLKGLGHDSSSVTEIMNDALASVKGTAFGLGDAATVAASLSAAGVQQGGELTDVLKTVADTAQISGRSLTDIGTIFGSVAARGKLQGDDMLQLMSSGVPVLQLLAKHLHTTSANVSDMVSQGKIDFKTFAAAMQEGMGGAALSAGNTFTGALANVKAALGRLGEQAATPVLEGLRNVFNGLIPFVDQLTTSLKPLTDSLGGGLSKAAQLAGNQLAVLTKGMSDGSVSIQDLVGQLTQLAGGFALLAGVGGNIGTISGVFSKLGSTGSKGVQSMLQTLGKLPSGISDLFGKIGGLGGYFNQQLRDSMAIDGDPFASAIQRIQSGIGRMSDLFGGVSDAVRKKLTPALAGIAFDWQNSPLYTAFTSMGDGVKSLASGIGDRISTGFAAAAGKINTSPLGRAFSAIGSRMSPIFSKSVRDAMTLDGDPFASFLSNMSSKVGAVTGRIGAVFAPVKSALGNVFGGVGDLLGSAMSGISGPLQTAMNNVGSMVARFFNPSNFMRFFGIGAIVAALVAGVGLLNQSMGGQLSGMVAQLASQAPALITQFMSAILAALPGVMTSGAQIIVSLLNGITAALPSLLSGAGQIISSLVIGLAQALSTLIPAAMNVITTLVLGLVQMLPQIIDAGLQLLLGLVQGLINALPQLIASLPTIIFALVNGFVTALPQILQTGIQLLVALVNGIVAAIPQLIAMLPTIINTIVNVLVANLPTILQAGIQLLLALINGLVKAIPKLVSYLPTIIAVIVSTLSAHLPQIITAAIQIIVALVSGLMQAIPRIISALPRIISAIKDGFSRVDWASVGRNIIDGIKNGIVAFAHGIADAAKNAAKGALDGVKSLLGIHSPSRVFRDQVGFMIGAGMALGVEDSGKLVERSLKGMNMRLVDGILPVGVGVGDLDGGSLDVNPVTSRPGGTVNQYIYPQQDDPRVQMRMWGREARKALTGAV